jgi:uncharacterized protein YprB with RNaseH-like and TPR domain
VRCWCAQPPRFSTDARALQLLLPERPEDITDPDQWLFLETETTGLSGGSGTYAFLVGVAWWESGGLEIEQFFMREYSEERATPRAHLDFLHPARNLWRLRLGSVRLSELERYVLGWDRGADLLSGLIPQIYFDYLRGGPPERLVPVLNHNQMDLRGLAALSSRILHCLATLKTWGKTDWNCLGSPASVKSEASTREPVIFMRSPLLRFCPLKRTAQPGARWHG